MEFDVKQLAQAMKMIAEEKNLPEDLVQEIVESALAAAYKRDYGDREQEVRVAVNLNNGAVDVYVQKEVVAVVGDPHFEISLEDAKKAKKDAVIGDLLEQYVEVKTFGRVAAQTAKQVIMQRLRESEREVVMAEYEDKIGSLVNGVVTRVENRLVRVEVGKAQAIMPASEQSSAERYFPGQRLKLYLKEIEKSFRGPQLIVSRGSAELVKQLFYAEVPEMEGGAVEMKAIAREAGVRTKLAVHSTVQGVDPVGTFVGGHGTRVNAVVSEIGDQEKIDIVVWDENIEVFIASALAPTKVTSVTLDTDAKRAKVVVPEDQLSVAIGKGGQNVRLASKLTGFEIDITADKRTEAIADTPSEPVTVDKVQKPKLKRKSDLENSLLSAIDEHAE
ncbi:MAG TPA: transcription termination factor NusA [Candidatus Saccharibacteria bacterium]|jgi:N utilization substance protein A|nr:transcription termination factor NusA [Candidatus Saccharibacteria bacterium]HMT55252.1 transcription termination factor NusA [Candidatus Saccharibacteria bacterium]